MGSVSQLCKKFEEMFAAQSATTRMQPLKKPRMLQKSQHIQIIRSKFTNGREAEKCFPSRSPKQEIDLHLQHYSSGEDHGTNNDFLCSRSSSSLSWSSSSLGLSLSDLSSESLEELQPSTPFPQPLFDEPHCFSVNTLLSSDNGSITRFEDIYCNYAQDKRWQGVNRPSQSKPVVWFRVAPQRRETLKEYSVLERAHDREIAEREERRREQRERMLRQQELQEVEQRKREQRDRMQTKGVPRIVRDVSYLKRMPGYRPFKPKSPTTAEIFRRSAGLSLPCSG